MPAPPLPTVLTAGSRRAVLPDGRTLTVRPITLDDVDGLVALYDGISVADRHRRFFSAYRPDRAFCRREATVADRGGCGLVAVVSGPMARTPGSAKPQAGSDGQADELVATANYSLLPTGHGELAIAVAAAWRGWLGPYLLDALVEAAAARDVPSLEAEVLTVNWRMLALFRARGGVVLHTDDPSVTRVLVPVTADPPALCRPL